MNSHKIIKVKLMRILSKGYWFKLLNIDRIQTYYYGINYNKILHHFFLRDFLTMVRAWDLHIGHLGFVSSQGTTQFLWNRWLHPNLTALSDFFICSWQIEHYYSLNIIAGLKFLICYFVNPFGTSFYSIWKS